MDKHKEHISEKHHLSEEEIALCAEAIAENRFNSLPENWREHMEDCTDCASEVMTVRELLAETEEESSTATDPQKKHNLRNLLFIALTAASIATLYFIIFTPEKSNPDTAEMIAEMENSIIIPDSLEDSPTNIVQNPTEIPDTNNDTSQKENLQKQKQPEPLIAAAFKTHAELEQLYQDFQGNYRGDNIKVTSIKTVKYPKSQCLLWENPDRQNLVIEIWNNKAQLTKELQSNTNEIKIPELNDGLYYWKLINEDFDLIYVGKIKVQ